MTAWSSVTRDPDRTARQRTRSGVMGVFVTAMLVLVALQLDRLPYLSNGANYVAWFAEAGGLHRGDVVRIAGVAVGKVDGVHLGTTDGKTSVKVSFSMDDTVRVGDLSTADISTETVLGRRALTITARGDTKLRPGGVIPLAHTTSPYSLTDVVTDASNNIEETNTQQLSQALDAMSDTFANTPADVRAAIDGLSKLSKSLNERDESLGQLLSRGQSVTQVVADRSTQINQLMLNANLILGELQQRRVALDVLLQNIQNVVRQVRGFISDNNTALTPTLQKLDRVVKIVQDNRDNLNQTLTKLPSFANALGETVANGPYWQGMVGIPTVGDYTSVFLKLFKLKFPEAFNLWLKIAPLPNNWGLVPEPTGPDVTGPTPTQQYPSPNLPTLKPQPSTQPSTQPKSPQRGQR